MVSSSSSASHEYEGSVSMSPDSSSGQYSSLCVSAVVLTLGGDDIEDGVPDREKVDCERDKVDMRDKQERDKHAETTNARSNIWHHGWHVDGVKCALRHLEPWCECDHMCKVLEKKHVWGVSVYTPVGYSGSLSTVNETNCNKKRSLKKYELHQLLDVSHDESLEEECHLSIVLEKLVLQFPHQTHDEDGFWERLQLGSLIEVASVHSCPICSMWDTIVLGIFWIQVEEEIGETHGEEQGKEQRGKERTTAQRGWPCRRHETRSCRHLSQMCCATQYSARALCTEKVTCEVYWLHLPSVTVDCYQLQTKPTATNNFFKMDWNHELHQLLDVSQFHQESLEEERCHLWYCWEGMGSARSSPDSRWRRFFDCDCSSEVWSKSHRCILVRFVQCEIPLSLISLEFLSGNDPPVPTYPFRCTSARPSQIGVVIHDRLGLWGKRSWIPL